MGAGDDTFGAAADVAATATIYGGAGTDTLVLTETGGHGADAGFGNVAGIGVLSIAETAGAFIC